MPESSTFSNITHAIYENSPNLHELLTGSAFKSLAERLPIVQHLKKCKNLSSVSIIKDLSTLPSVLFSYYNNYPLGHTKYNYDSYTVMAAISKIICKISMIITLPKFLGIEHSAASLASNFFCEPIGQIFELLSKKFQDHPELHSKQSTLEFITASLNEELIAEAIATSIPKNALAYTIGATYGVLINNDHTDNEHLAKFLTRKLIDNNFIQSMCENMVDSYVFGITIRNAVAFIRHYFEEAHYQSSECELNSNSNFAPHLFHATSSTWTEERITTDILTLIGTDSHNSTILEIL